MLSRCVNQKQILKVVLAVLLFIVELLGMKHFYGNHSVSQLFVLVLYCAVADIVIWQSYRVFLLSENVNRHDGCSGRCAQLFVLLFVAFTVAVILEGFTVLGSPASHFSNIVDWNKKRLIFYFLMSYCAIFYLFQSGFSLKALFRSVMARIKAADYVSLLTVAFFIVFGCSTTAFVIGFINAVVYFLLVITTSVFTACSGIRKRMSALPVAFFIAAFSIGVFLVVSTPITTGISWDDQIHYSNALSTSYLFETQKTDTDINFAAEAVRRTQGYEELSLSHFDRAEIIEHARELNDSYKSDIDSGRVQVNKHEEFVYTLSSIGYIPSAIGLWLARLLRFDFSSMIQFARICNLFSYCLAIAVAIGVAPSKKGLFAFAGMLPTSLFLAACFSYDAWLISLSMLGFAYFLRYAWGDLKEFTVRNMSFAFIFTFLGLAVKAVYFPIIGLFFMVPRNRFVSSRQRTHYYAAVFILGLIAFASFALPFLFSTASGSNVGDMRGGSDVNSGQQIVYILADPLRYAGILVNYFATYYLNPMTSSEYAFNFAYLGSLAAQISVNALRGLVQVLPALCLMLVGLFSADSISVKHAGPAYFLWASFVFLFTVALVATALYVSFTPVGLGTVNGCQSRYLLPLLVPCLSFILNQSRLVFGGSNQFLLICVLFSFALATVCEFVLVVGKCI